MKLAVPIALSLLATAIALVLTSVLARASRVVPPPTEPGAAPMVEVAS